MRHLRLVILQGAALAALAGCCLRAGGEDGGGSAGTTSSSGARTTSSGSGSTPSSSGTGSSGGTAVGADGGIDCGEWEPGFDFCYSLLNCLLISNSCWGMICSACTVADGEVLWGPDRGPDAGLGDYNLLLSGLCPPSPSTCDAVTLECLRQEAPKVLSASCAAALTSLVGLDLDGDGGSACDYTGPAANATTFCTVVGGCVGGTTHCEQVICPSCNTADGAALGGTGSESFDGRCPALAQAGCADYGCFLDAGPEVLSPSCAAAVALLAEQALDGGSP